MVSAKIVAFATLILGLGAFLACNENDKDELQSNAWKAAGLQTSQKAAEKPNVEEEEEGEEGPAVPPSVAAEKPAPLQTPGKRFVYNFDNDSPGQLPAKFHGAKTGGGVKEKWSVVADPTAPSKPNVVAQTSTDQTDYRFPLLISDEGSFQDLDLSVRFKAVSGNVDRAGGDSPARNPRPLYTSGWSRQDGSRARGTGWISFPSPWPTLR